MTSILLYRYSHAKLKINTLTTVSLLAPKDLFIIWLSILLTLGVPDEVMKVIPETCRKHYVRCLGLYFMYTFFIMKNKYYTFNEVDTRNLLTQEYYIYRGQRYIILGLKNPGIHRIESH